MPAIKPYSDPKSVDMAQEGFNVTDNLWSDPRVVAMVRAPAVFCFIDEDRSFVPAVMDFA